MAPAVPADGGSTWPELDALKATFNGNVVLPSDEQAYKAACQTWHLNPLLTAPRRPKVVLQPRGVDRRATAKNLITAERYSLRGACGSRD